MFESKVKSCRQCFQQIGLVARYEGKLVQRDILFWMLLVLVVGGVVFYQAEKQGDFGGLKNWCFIALPSAMPLLNAYLFNMAQSFMLLFVCANLYRREQRVSTLHVLEVHPVCNVCYTLGKALGVFRVFFGVNLLSVGIAFFINAFASKAPLSISFYIYYLLTWTLPTLIFFIGCSFFVLRVVRQAALGLFVLLLLLAAFLMVSPPLFHGTFDVLGTALPNVFSRVVGHPFLASIVLQRFAVLWVGVALLLLSVGRVRRVANVCRGRLYVVSVGTVLFACGCMYLWFYYHGQHEVERVRARYRTTFLKYDRGNSPHVERHEIFYRQEGDKLHLTSRLQLTSFYQKDLDSLVLYLNPGLQIKKLTLAGSPVEYEREQQAVIIRHALRAFDTLHLSMEYAGRVDEQICYLDMPSRVSESYGDTPFRFGQRYSYVGREFTLLLPEVLWYPVAVPPTCLRNPEVPRFDFTRFVLHLPREDYRSIITLGTDFHDGKRGVVYKSEKKYEGLPLCIGNYEKKSLWMGTYSVDLYTFRGGRFYNGFSLLDAESLKTMLVGLQDMSNLPPYPHERLALVETPISFFSPLRAWKGTSDFVQPGVVFLPEEGMTLEQGIRLTLFSGRDQDEKTMQKERQRSRLYGVISASLLSRTMGAYRGSNPVERLFSLYDRGREKELLSPRYVKPMFRDYSCYIQSDSMPVMDLVLRKLEEERKLGFSLFFEDSKLPSYLFHHSFEHALQDTSLATPVREEIIEKKSQELRAYLRCFIEEKAMRDFLKGFRNRYRYQPVTLSQFDQALEERFHVSLYPFLDRWYRDTCLPVFDVRDVVFGRYKDEYGKSRFKVHFKVQNIGKVGGSISALLPAVSLRLPMRECYFWLSPGDRKEIKLTLASRQNMFSVNMIGAANLPNNFFYSVPRELPLLDEAVGVFDCLEGDFDDSSREIMVDNEDAGFRLVEKEERKTLALLHNKKEKYVDKANLWKRTSRWQYMLNSRFHGNIVRSACMKFAGDGSAKAEWTVKIPRDGVYELFTRYFKVDKGRASTVFPGLKLYYQVSQGEESTDVVIELDDEMEKISQHEGRWLSLGEFRLKAGQVTLSVSDRGNPLEKDEIQIIFADAVKLVRKRD